MKLSARNQLAGTVKKLVPGAVNAEVTLDCDGVEIVAIITSDSVQRLGLVAGKRAYAVVKASDVLVAID
jgi:molybdopterin-binding protein